jgi:type II secretory pathway component PulF
MADKQKQHKARKYHISAKYRDYFTSNLALLLNAAVPIQEALGSLQETSKSKPLNDALEQMKQDINDGLPLWKTLDRAGIVSSQTLALVELGEQSGRLVENLEVAARQEEKQRIFKSKVRSALLYPSFVLGLTLIVGICVAWFLLPRLSETFSQLNVALPPISKFFIGIGVFLKSNGLWAVPSGLALLGLLIYALFAAPKTKAIGQALLFKVPGISKMMHEVEVARFGYLLGTLMEAGLSVTQSLESLRGATAATSYRRLYQKLLDSFEEGYSFRTTLPKNKATAGLIPPPVQQMVIAGERSGSLPETLLSIGHIYEERADISTQNLEAVLEPILLIFVWLGVMGVAIAVILPIYSLVGGLGV